MFSRFSDKWTNRLHLLGAPKSKMACSTKWFHSILLLVGGGCIFSIFPCWPLHTYPHRVVKGPRFEARTRLESDIWLWSPM